jgi:hypothetical protein
MRSPSNLSRRSHHKSQVRTGRTRLAGYHGALVLALDCPSLERGTDSRDDLSALLGPKQRVPPADEIEPILRRLFYEVGRRDCLTWGKNNRTGDPAKPRPPSTDAGADRPKLGLSPPNRTLPLSATLAGVARISMVIFSSCFCIVVSVPVVALRANRTDEVAALVQLSGIPFRAIAPKIGHPFTYIAALAVLSGKFGHVVSSPCAHIAWTQSAASDTR